jgi:hypothetical protein
MQILYVYYSGTGGGAKFLTAPSDEEARELVLAEYGKTEYNSLFPCNVFINASGTYFLRDIPTRWHQNLLEATE